ncbi:3'(2'),5'-bisphosphate nucleotidase CysQ [Zooshikella ganghwensis]|uniref:3'(2'),5'-bisphosphate nucleotidase CysQ n=1 Tax=Zooshikella ganghwensis TaxID=202772 RepID=A0A4P9VIJ1_9GAMM|nr:3'(2'),5'-bisphosphate nucleotidase CysQ [Zooshikella ganghwensis]RDH42346.1 3'(2'),5'-bisphosphate nucleotidase [Zooshikella ganghwensis]
MDKSKLISELKSVCQRAGTAIIEVYQHEDFGIREKLDHSPVTEADMASHQIIVEGLQQLTPEIPVLSEESAEVPFSTRHKWSTFWLVDPLDGTKEFINRNGEFTINIALIENNRPVLGVIFVPVTNEIYYASEQVGAFWESAAGEVKPIQVNSLHRVDVVNIIASRSHMGERLSPLLSHLAEILPAINISHLGSALKFCLVAEGKADFYPRLTPTSEWDTAAAQAIIEVAGGSIVDFNFQPLTYNTQESLLNPPFLVFGDKQYSWQEALMPVLKDIAKT